MHQRTSNFLYNYALATLMVLAVVPLQRIGLGSNHLLVYFFAFTTFCLMLRFYFDFKSLLFLCLMEIALIATMMISETVVIQNSLFLYFQVILLLASVRIPNHYLMRASYVFDRYAIFFILCVILYFWIFKSFQTSGEISRGKFDGSTSFIATLGILLAIYIAAPGGSIDKKWQTLILRLPAYCIGFLPAIISGVRGSIIFGVIGSFIVLRNEIKLSRMLFVYSVFALASVLAFYSLGIFDLFLERMTFSGTSDQDLILATSGRSASWVFIYDQVTQSNFIRMTFGHGLGAMAIATTGGYEYPHFDALLIVYETGLVGLSVFALCLVRICQQYSLLTTFVVLSNGLHTNFSYFLGLCIFIPLLAGKQLRAR